MTQQHFENHTQHDKFLYVLTGLLIILGIIMGIAAKRFASVIPLGGLQYIMPIFVPVLLVLILVKTRKYATTLQDRIIKQEVQLRYFIATGNPLPSLVTKKHMIGLRFAGDNEFVSLVQEVMSNPALTTKEIKQRVKNWKSDFDRV